MKRLLLLILMVSTIVNQLYAMDAGSKRNASEVFEAQSEPVTKNKQLNHDTIYNLAFGGINFIQRELENNLDVDAVSDKGYTLLHFAILFKLDSVAEFLLSKNANKEIKDPDGNSPLHLAAFKGSSSIAKLLLTKNADVNAINNNKETPLHLAAREGHFDTIKVLLDFGANVFAKDAKLNTALHLAAESGNADVVRTFIICGVILDLYNIEGFVALGLAAKKYNVEAIKTLLAGGADYKLRNAYKNIMHINWYTALDIINLDLKYPHINYTQRNQAEEIQAILSSDDPYMHPEVVSIRAQINEQRRAEKFNKESKKYGLSKYLMLREAGIKNIGFSCNLKNRNKLS